MKGLLLALLFFVLGIPITDRLGFVLAFVGVTTILVSPIRPLEKKRIALFLLIFMAGVGQRLLRGPGMEEGHQVFLPAPVGSALRDSLPPLVYDHLERRFHTRFPSMVGPVSNMYGDWRASSQPSRPYAHSMDSLFRPSPLSRQVDELSFHDLGTLRPGFANDKSFNWYSWASGVPRATMPFVFRLDLNDSSVGSALTWRGTLFWEGLGGIEVLEQPSGASRTIRPEDVGGRVYGDGIDGLVVELVLSPRWKALLVARNILRIMGVIGLLTLLVSPSWRSLCGLFWPCGIAAVLIALKAPGLLGQQGPYPGGSDGLTFEHFARDMVRLWGEGRFGESLMGGEPIFYFMPGLRYLKALEKVFFGDTPWLMVWLLLLLPLAWWALSVKVVPRVWAVVLLALFFCTSWLSLLGTGFEFYVQDTLLGRAGPVASLGLITALVVMLKREKSPLLFLGLGLLMALTVWVRPNLLLGCLGAFSMWAFHQRLGREALLGVALGFIPLMALMPLHNRVYGGQWVAFTSTTAIPENLKTPPRIYFRAAASLPSKGIDGPEALKVRNQVSLWLGRGLWPIRLGVLLLTVLALIDWPRSLKKAVAFHKADAFSRRLVAGAALGILLPFLFYAPKDRLTYLGWSLALLSALGWLAEIVAIRNLQPWKSLRSFLGGFFNRVRTS